MWSCSDTPCSKQVQLHASKMDIWHPSRRWGKKNQNNNSKRKQSSSFSIWNSVFSVSAHYILYCHCSPLEWVCLHLSWAEGRGVLLPWPFYSRKPELLCQSVLVGFVLCSCAHPGFLQASHCSSIMSSLFKDPKRATQSFWIPVLSPAHWLVTLNWYCPQICWKHIQSHHPSP